MNASESTMQSDTPKLVAPTEGVLWNFYVGDDPMTKVNNTDSKTDIGLTATEVGKLLCSLYSLHGGETSRIPNVHIELASLDEGLWDYPAPEYAELLTCLADPEWCDPAELAGFGKVWDFYVIKDSDSGFEKVNDNSALTATQVAMLLNAIHQVYVVAKNYDPPSVVVMPATDTEPVDQAYSLVETWDLYVASDGEDLEKVNGDSACTAEQIGMLLHEIYKVHLKEESEMPSVVIKLTSPDAEAEQKVRTALAHRCKLMEAALRSTGEGLAKAEPD